MSIEVDTGTYGAKRQSSRKANPRDILLKLMEEHKSTSEKDLRRLFTDKVIEDHDQLDAIIEYWFANNYRSLVAKKIETPETKATAVAARSARVAAVKAEIKVRAARMVLLDMVMPNGKALRDSTGKDCANAGGWLAKIAKAIKPTQIVGKALSEAQVRKFFSQ